MAKYDPIVGTLRWGDVNFGLADPSNPAPNGETTDQIKTAPALDGVVTANMLRPSIWFVAFAALLVVLYMLSGD